MNKPLWKSYKLYASLFLLLISAAGVLFFIEVKDAWELIKSERSEKTELAQINNRNAPPGIIPFSVYAADAKKYAVIDVREREEFSQGRITGALNYRLGDILNEETIRQEIFRNTQGKQRIFFCHDGKRSRIAAQRIQQEFGGVNTIIEKGFRQIRKDENNRVFWEGSLKHVLPQDHRYNKTPWIKRRDVRVNSLIDLSLERHETVKGLEGKTFRHAPLLLMSSRQIETLISTLGEDSVVALCNSKVSCFYTRILRYRLEEQGLTLAGYVRLLE
jgi:rhodanese-related sulfurtransferase